MGNTEPPETSHTCMEIIERADVQNIYALKIIREKALCSAHLLAQPVKLFAVLYRYERR